MSNKSALQEYGDDRFWSGFFFGCASLAGLLGTVATIIAVVF